MSRMELIKKSKLGSGWNGIPHFLSKGSIFPFLLYTQNIKTILKLYEGPRFSGCLF